jgi:hypothetical protein
MEDARNSELCGVFLTSLLISRPESLCSFGRQLGPAYSTTVMVVSMPSMACLPIVHQRR